MTIARLCRDINGVQICSEPADDYSITVPPRIMTHDDHPGKVYRFDHMEGQTYVYLESTIG